MDRTLELFCRLSTFVETALEVAERIDAEGLAAFRRKLSEAAEELERAGERIEVTLAAPYRDDDTAAAPW